MGGGDLFLKGQSRQLIGCGETDVRRWELAHKEGLLGQVLLSDLPY